MALAASLLSCMLRFWLLRLRGPLTPLQRARWLQSACQGVLASMGFGLRTNGMPPSHGLVVSNHLSYLDIIVYSAAMPCAFVSKAEVKRWPYFGRAARASGTIFLDRSSRSGAMAVAEEMLNRMKLPIPVLLFPEGTSTDGSEVLRFHSTLFQPAVDAGAPVTAAAVHYVGDEEVPERELCWFGDGAMLPHMWRLLNLPAFTAEINFAAPQLCADRRAAAESTHDVVAGMRRINHSMADPAEPAVALH